MGNTNSVSFELQTPSQPLVVVSEKYINQSFITLELTRTKSNGQAFYTAINLENGSSMFQFQEDLDEHLQFSTMSLFDLQDKELVLSKIRYEELFFPTICTISRFTDVPLGQVSDELIYSKVSIDNKKLRGTIRTLSNQTHNVQILLKERTGYVEGVLFIGDPKNGGIGVASCKRNNRDNSWILQAVPNIDLAFALSVGIIMLKEYKRYKKLQYTM
ncbi:hypothetical protein BC833DRAFT_600650 [Globomyces pollinis-pini]|nr:hypothetical protein BC833DRAFT_600650 [Globomyces pollinis-pini]KAJ2993920.1 hypothetical protein HDV02_001998 [Globomyces sp. JEL0801]